VVLLALSFWRKSSSRRKRLLAIGATFLLLFMIAVSGVMTPLSPEEAQSLDDQLRETQQGIQNMSLLSGGLTIFTNNFMISLVLFVPLVGPLFGVFVMHNTGTAIAAQSITASTHPPPILVLLILFIFPFTWMEFLAYSVAFSESIWLLWRIIQRKGKMELVNTLILILVCLLTLLAAAFIEMALIKSLI
jgi:hypothetical protein